jgi:hypothetical protein
MFRLFVCHFSIVQYHTQCTVKELNSKWEGTLSVGVTSQLPRQACLVEKAQELKKRSYILCTEAGATCLYVGGKVYTMSCTCTCMCIIIMPTLAHAHACGYSPLLHSSTFVYLHVHVRVCTCDIPNICIYYHASGAYPRFQ